MVRSATHAFMVTAIVLLSGSTFAQVVESTSVPELQDMVRQLIRENAQLKMELEGVKRELEKFKSVGAEPTAETDRSVTILIDSIRDLSDDGERQMRIGELKRQLPSAQAQVEKTRKVYEDMIEKNALDKKKWDNHWPPYSGPRKPGARWEKPHPDHVLGPARMEMNKAAKHRDNTEREIKKLERGPTDLQVLIVGKSVVTSDEEPAVEYQVMCEGALARRAQAKKRGDRVIVTGLTTDSSDGFTAMIATSITDPKPSNSAPKAE